MSMQNKKMQDNQIFLNQTWSTNVIDVTNQKVQ